MFIKPLPDYKELIEHFYVIDNVIYWKKTSSKKIKIGAVAGSITKSGYRRLYFNGKHYFCSRLLWKMRTGEDPDGMIDHINGDTLDDREENHRVVTCSGNQKNARVRDSSVSKCSGVTYSKRSRRWEVRASKNKKEYYLGSFERMEDAIKLRNSIEKDFNYHKNHNRKTKIWRLENEQG